MPLFNYNREPRIILTGNEPPKKGAALYFDLFTRKFWNYIKLNMLYCITSIVTFAFYWCFLAMFIIPMIFNMISPDIFKELAEAGNTTVESMQGSISFSVAAIGAVLLIIFFGGGIFSAGYNYVLRNYARQENAFLLSDYFEHTKKNIGLALAAALIDKLIVCTTIFGVVFYFSLMKTTGNSLALAAVVLLVLVFEIYAVMHTFIWTQLVTFELNIRQIYKNSFLLSFAAGVRSIAYIAAMLIYTVLLLAMFIRFWPITILFVLLIAISAFNLGGHLYSYPVIKKYMIDNNNKADDEAIDETEKVDDGAEGNEE